MTSTAIGMPPTLVQPGGIRLREKRLLGPTEVGLSHLTADSGSQRRRRRSARRAVSDGVCAQTLLYQTEPRAVAKMVQAGPQQVAL
jgi:hypothetical protein